jgi:uncharacterized protein YjbI with pentapeptide repeats
MTNTFGITLTFLTACILFIWLYFLSQIILNKHKKIIEEDTFLLRDAKRKNKVFWYATGMGIAILSFLWFLASNNSLTFNINTGFTSYKVAPGADFTQKSLTKEDFRSSILTSANFKNTKLINSDFTNANLSQSNFEGASLKGANLKGADLEGANLKGADLEGANFEGANLEGADLKGANLKGADLKGVNLKGANVCMTIWTNGKISDLNCPNLKYTVGLFGLSGKTNFKEFSTMQNWFREQGYTLTGSLLEKRPKWLSLKSAVFYYSLDSKDRANKLAQKVSTITNKIIEPQLVDSPNVVGVPLGQEKFFFYVHIL